MNTNDEVIEKLKEPRKILLTELLNTERSAYGRADGVWRALDSKAQGTVTIAGVFIAIGFAYVKDIREAKINFSEIEAVGLAVALSFFLLSVVLSLWVLWVRSKVAMPDGESDCLRMILDADEAELDECTQRYRHDLAGIWKRASANLKQHNSTKGKLLFYAQLALLLAIAILAFLEGLRNFV